MSMIFTNIANTINDSKFLTVIMTIIVIFTWLFLTIYFIKLLGNIRAFIVNKSNTAYLNNQKIITLSMPDRIELSNSVLDLISFMVNNEIVSFFKSYIILNNPYDISRMDEDVVIISQNVFNGINKVMFIDPNLVLTENYLMEFITKKTISTMLDVAQTHNANMRGHKQSSED